VVEATLADETTAVLKVGVPDVRPDLAPTTEGQHSLGQPVSGPNGRPLSSLRDDGESFGEGGRSPRLPWGRAEEAACTPVGLLNLEKFELGPLPVLTGGTGPPLFYIGGLLPVAGVDSVLAKRSADYSARPFADVRTVIYANRRPGLPRGMAISDIAAEHAQAISALGRGPVDVLGVSTGGSIAQQLAADHPRSVQRLVLASTGCHLSAMTKRMQARIAQHIRTGEPDQALAAMVLGVFFSPSQALARLLAPLAGRLGKNLGDLEDLATTIEAEDEFNLASSSTNIEARTLIVAGARDRFYPRPLLEETQRLIPGSVLHTIPRRGHLTAMTAPRFATAVRAHIQP
jgi:pimeloyl-ACP methyl ester carboxylesterase